NNFYGGQIGASFEAWVCNCIVISGFAKVALGGNWEEVRQVGSTTLDTTTIETNAGGPFLPPPPPRPPRGLVTAPVPGRLAPPPSHISVIPDLNINVGYAITPNVQAYVGYNYMYVSNVARLGNQSVAGAGQGHLNLHGADLGVQFRY